MCPSSIPVGRHREHAGQIRVAEMIWHLSDSQAESPIGLAGPWLEDISAQLDLEDISAQLDV